MSDQERRIEYALRKVFDRMIGTPILDLREVGEGQAEWEINLFIRARLEEIRLEGHTEEYIFSFSFLASADLGPQDKRDIEMGGAFIPRRAKPLMKNRERIY